MARARPSRIPEHCSRLGHAYVDDVLEGVYYVSLPSGAYAVQASYDVAGRPYPRPDGGKNFVVLCGPVQTWTRGGRRADPRRVAEQFRAAVGESLDAHVQALHPRWADMHLYSYSTALDSDSYCGYCAPRRYTMVLHKVTCPDCRALALRDLTDEGRAMRAVRG